MDGIISWPFTHFMDNPWAGTTLILLVVVYVVILVLQIFKNKHTLSISMILGFIVGMYYLAVSSGMEESEFNANYVDGIYMWLTMAWSIFMLLLLVVLPIYIFSMVSTTFVNARHLKGGRKLLFSSFFSLWAMSLLGIIIAILFFPIMYIFGGLIRTSLPHDISHDAVGIFGGIWPAFEQAIDKLFKYYGLIAVSMVILAIVFALIMNLLHRHHHDVGEGLISFIEKTRDVVTIYLKGVGKMVPYVIAGMLVVLFANYQNTFLNTVSNLSFFVFIFFVGLVLIWSIEYGIVSGLRKSKDELGKKEFRKITKEYMINDFAVQSAPILYPITVSYVRALGVEEEVAKATPTFTTFMGYSMCGGFYPALVVLFTLIQLDPFIDGSIMTAISDDAFIRTMAAIGLMIPLIMFMTLGMTGVPGIDVAIIIGLLTTLGLDPTYFFMIYLIDPMLDKFRGVGNSMGFAAATSITNRIFLLGKEKED